MKSWKNAEGEEVRGGVKPAVSPPPKPKSDNYRRPLERVEAVFVNGMRRNFVGTTAIRLGKEIVINEQGTTIVISLRNVLYCKISTVKEQHA